MALPPTLTRKYYRERTNPRLKVSSQAGNPIGRCGSGSRWLRFAFDVMDWPPHVNFAAIVGIDFLARHKAVVDVCGDSLHLVAASGEKVAAALRLGSP